MEKRRERFYDQPVGCADCHSGPFYTDFHTHDVGAASGPYKVMGPAINTPTRLSLSRGPPYLHDGSAATLLDAFGPSNSNALHERTSRPTEDRMQTCNPTPDGAQVNPLGRRDKSALALCTIFHK